MKKRKKITAAIMVFLLCVSGTLGVSKYIKAQEPLYIETVADTLADQGAKAEQFKNFGMDINAKGAVLIDQGTGKVLFEKDCHKELEPASVTKIMTMLLAMEAVENGRISLKDQVTISDYAASMGGSQMYMEPGETHSLEELLKGMAMASANDAAVAVAEYVYGSEEIFVEHMNKRAKELGMMDSHFVNVNGLPVAEHVTSAYDIAIMSKYLLNYPKVSQWLTTWQDKVTVGLPGKEKEFGLSNTNKLLKQYSGACGIKTGFTQGAGFCLSGAAKKDSTLLIAVVLGCDSSKERFAEAAKLLNYGFANYTSVTVARKNQVVKKNKNLKGTPITYNAICKEDVKVLVKKGEENKVTHKVVMYKKVNLPLKKGAKIGRMDIYVNKVKAGSSEIVSNCKVTKAAITTYYIRKIKSIFK